MSEWKTSFHWSAEQYLETSSKTVSNISRNYRFTTKWNIIEKIDVVFVDILKQICDIISKLDI